MGSNDGVVERLVLLEGDGNLGERFNIVIVAEGYRADAAAEFYEAADGVLVALRQAAPFASRMAAFNVLRLDVWSTDNGADSKQAAVRTYFDAGFAASPPNLLVVDDDLVVETVAAALTAPDGTAAHAHKIIVLVNTPIDGGSGGVGAGIAVASSARNARTTIHELGHTFGLVDEYEAPPSLGGGAIAAEIHGSIGVGPNRSPSAELADLPWRDLVAAGTPLPTVAYPGQPLPDDTVGAFAVDIDYRAQWYCKMRCSDDDYCTVCERWIAAQLEAYLPLNEVEECHVAPTVPAAPSHPVCPVEPVAVSPGNNSDHHHDHQRTCR